MNAYQIILKKREGKKINKQEIEFLLGGYVKGWIADYQMAAFLMAVYFQGMSDEELTEFTEVMAHSGEIINLSSIAGVKVDKHSTGGVGDKTTLVLAPLAAAAGIPVAKMSGRGLGHTGGTIDKLRALEGFEVHLSREEFIDRVLDNGLCIVGQTDNLVPADKQLYALRDVTATVDSIPLIASSIMSKKYASGTDALVLDVKMGAGAFMKTLSEAQDLAESMVRIGTRLGVKTAAFITDMNQPLGRTVGNALEMKEVLLTLRGEGPLDLTNLCLKLGSCMLVLGGKEDHLELAEARLKEILYSGRALEKFISFVKKQGGSIQGIEDVELLPRAGMIQDFKAQTEGFVQEVDAFKVGMAAMTLGAGREKKEDKIDLAVGVELFKKIGERVKKGETLFRIHSNSEKKFEAAIELLKEALVISVDEPLIPPLIYDYITGE
ncbi:pyrimidine-nucleoside phosphorylase [Candidatus Contubernalis alkaliaceticus]|uniref:pyrimidine-nucleoside phosphorylase n=1 Tax=Candidatus Contubernalis alkaliaceticus TaxID=338645 RepID=UPI001F4C1ED1|nr:pyrimidine-nucleoside phosphorylase [Candidatus Contubernalis alkalaceticus]UNC92526.1 pyrimidine-nucleoside phosphorylase [Candidatus Contubernalis alkalaceticus]